MEFVSFHVALSPDRAVHPNQTVAHKEYLAMLDMMFGSAALFHAGARRVVLTDEGTSFNGMAATPHRIERAPMDAGRLMYERALAQLRHVRQCRFDTPVAILDSDILVNAGLGPLLERDFDVALTWRPENREQPINGGFMLLNNRRPEVSRRFFETYVGLFEDRYSDDHASWFGDQLALRDAVGLDVEEMAQADIVEVHGCRVLLLPCDVYNFSPANRFSEIETPLPGKAILHFKGERKRLMAPYWHAWLRPSQSMAPWVQWRARRQRTWLSAQAAAEGRDAREPVRAQA